MCHIERRQRRQKKEKRKEREKERANYVWKIRAFGLFRVYISQEKYTHTHTRTQMHVNSYSHNI